VADAARGLISGLIGFAINLCVGRDACDLRPQRQHEAYRVPNERREEKREREERRDEKRKGRRKKGAPLFEMRGFPSCPSMIPSSIFVGVFSP